MFKPQKEPLPPKAPVLPVSWDPPVSGVRPDSLLTPSLHRPGPPPYPAASVGVRPGPLSLPGDSAPSTGPQAVGPGIVQGQGGRPHSPAWTCGSAELAWSALSAETQPPRRGRASGRTCRAGDVRPPLPPSATPTLGDGGSWATGRRCVLGVSAAWSLYTDQCL